MKTIEQQAAETIYANANQVSGELISIQQPEWADISPKYGMTRAKQNDYCRHDLYQLAEAMMANNPPQYARYIVWLRAMFRGHQVPDFVVDLNLETEQSALSRVLPPEYQPTVLRFIQAARDALKKEDTLHPSFLNDTEINAALSEEYLRILLAGERGKASELVAGAIDSGVSIRDIYLRVFKPCLYEVGRMWQTGQITVAHEHFFSAATQFIISELYPRIHKRADPNGKVAVAACVEGELHEIGLRMISDLLELEGWQTFYLGANTPALSVIEITREKKAHLLALSICLPSSGPAARELISLARERLGDTVKIVIGGYTMAADPVYAASFGADGLVDDTAEAVTFIGKLVSEGRDIAG